MKIKNIRYFFIIAILTVSCIISWNLYFKVYLQQDTVDIHQFPKSFSQWDSQELPITEDEYALLETRNAFTRRYFTPEGKEVYLFIVYSQYNRKVSHPPEVCYLGNGVSIIKSDIERLNGPEEHSSLKTNKLLLEKGDSRQVANYWFKVGNSFTANYWKQQGLIAFKTLIGKPASSALIRVSASVKDGEMANAEHDVKDFIRTVIPLLFQYLP